MKQYYDILKREAGRVPSTGQETVTIVVKIASGTFVEFYLVDDDGLEMLQARTRIA